MVVVVVRSADLLGNKSQEKEDSVTIWRSGSVKMLHSSIYVETSSSVSSSSLSAVLLFFFYSLQRKSN